MTFFMSCHSPKCQHHVILVGMLYECIHLGMYKGIHAYLCICMHAFECMYLIQICMYVGRHV